MLRGLLFRYGRAGVSEAVVSFGAVFFSSENSGADGARRPRKRVEEKIARDREDVKPLLTCPHISIFTIFTVLTLFFHKPLDRRRKI